MSFDFKIRLHTRGLSNWRGECTVVLHIGRETRFTLAITLSDRRFPAADGRTSDNKLYTSEIGSKLFVPDYFFVDGWRCLHSCVLVRSNRGEVVRKIVFNECFTRPARNDQQECKNVRIIYLFLIRVLAGGFHFSLYVCVYIYTGYFWNERQH